jgi:CBS-domain-containing membrane protein
MTLTFYTFYKCSATDVAPLWDAGKQTFSGMMTTEDFIHTLRKYQENSSTVQNFELKSVEEIINLEIHNFGTEFQSIDAEDSIHQLCAVLARLETDYAAVLDPDNGSLVAVLGYMDILHLLIQLAQRFPSFFETPLEVASIGNFRNIVTAPRSTNVAAALATVDIRDLSCLPITDETGRVIGLYQPKDVSYIQKSANTEVPIANVSTLMLDDVLSHQQATQSLSYSCICTLNESIKVVIERMANSRLTQLACVDQAGACLGIIQIKDILSFIFPGDNAI